MADAQARIRIIVEGKEQAQQQFEAIFNSVVQGSNKTLTAQQALAKTNEQGVKWLREQANAATNAAQPNYQLAKSYTDMANSIEGTNKGFRVLGMNIVDIAAKFYLLQTSIRFVYEKMIQLFELAELGAKVEQASISFERLQRHIGFNADLMDRLRIASRGLMTDYELQNKAAAALAGTQGKLAVELAEALPQLLQFSLAIKTLRPEIESADLVYQKLLLGIRRGSSKLIDDANIVIKVGGAHEEYAKSIGKAVDELTAEEQQLSVLYSTLRGGNVLLEQAGINVEALTDRYGQFKTALENTHQAGGRFMDEFLGPSIDVLTEQLGIINENANRWDRLGRILSFIPTSLTIAYTKGWEMIAMLVEQGTLLGSVYHALLAVDRETNIFGGRVAEAKNELQGFVDELFNVEPAADESADAADKFADAWENALLRLADQHASFQEKWLDTTANISEKVFDETQKLEDELTDIQTRAEKQRLDVISSAADQRSTIDEAYYERRADLERRIQELTEGLGETERQKELAEHRRSLDDPNVPEKFKINLRIRIAGLEQEIEEERKQRQIQDLRDELTRLDQKHAEEIEKLKSQSGERLAIISKTEEDATAKAGEESSKRLKGWTDDLVKLNQSIQTDYKSAWLGAMISVSEKGSDLNRMLEDQRLRVKGLSDETIAYYRALEDLITKSEDLYKIDPSLAPGGTQEQRLQNYLNQIRQLPTIQPATIQPAKISESMIINNPLYPYVHAIYKALNLDIAAGLLGFTPNRQRGGSVMSGHPYLVGEAGPELFVPSAGGAIAPNTMFGGGMSVTVQAGAFLGSNADAVRLGSQLIPIIAKGLQSYNLTPWSLGSRRTGTQ